MNLILIAVISLGAIALVLAAVLYVASKKFAVYEDPRIAHGGGTNNRHLVPYLPCRRSIGNFNYLLLAICRRAMSLDTASRASRCLDGR